MGIGNLRVRITECTAESLPVSKRKFTVEGSKVWKVVRREGKVGKLTGIPFWRQLQTGPSHVGSFPSVSRIRRIGVPYPAVG
jgi:hypothetical protein